MLMGSDIEFDDELIDYLSRDDEDYFLKEDEIN